MTCNNSNQLGFGRECVPPSMNLWQWAAVLAENPSLWCRRFTVAQANWVEFNGAERGCFQMKRRKGSDMASWADEGVEEG